MMMRGVGLLKTLTIVVRGREGGWNNRNYWTDAGVGEREMEKWVGRVGWGGGGLNGSARFMTLF
jgi:hypothetical protein